MAASEAHWLERWRWQFLLALFLSLPLLWPAIPPLTDLPGHMGRYKVQLDLASSPALQGFYDFHWQLIGNLGLDLLVVPLAALFGLELAVKLVVLAIPALTAFGMLWIAREVHGRVPPTALFALPLVLGHPFTFGFVNYALSMALAFNAFALWLYLGRTGRLTLRALLAVPISFLIWITHSFGWGVLGLLAFAGEVGRLLFTNNVAPAQAGASAGVSTKASNRPLPAQGRRVFEAALHCLPLALPAILMLLWRSGATEGGTGDWFNMAAKLQWLLMSLRDRWMQLDVLSVAVLLGVLLTALRSPKLGFDRTLGLAALILLAVYILLPRILLSSAYADMRLIPYALAVALLAIRAPADPRWMRALLLAGLAFVALRVGATTLSFAQHHQRQSAALEALNHVPKGARLLSLVGSACGQPWHSERLDHIPAFAIIRREAFSNDQWAMAGAQLLTIKKADAPGFVEDPAQFVTATKCRPDWRTLDDAVRTFPRAAFDWLWLLDRPADARLDEAGLEKVWTNGPDSLYRVHHNSPIAKAAP